MPLLRCVALAVAAAYGELQRVLARVGTLHYSPAVILA
jgi:hypothetical protein